MKVEKKPLAEITNRAIEVLSWELGPSDTLRFMNQFTNGSGNYVLERDVLFKDVTLDQIITEIKQTHSSQSTEPDSSKD